MTRCVGQYELSELEANMRQLRQRSWGAAEMDQIGEALNEVPLASSKFRGERRAPSPSLPTVATARASLAGELPKGG